MAQESVINLLARMKRLNTQIKNIGGILGIEDEIFRINKLYLSGEPDDDFGDRIVQELEERDGEITDFERSSVLEYLARDYQRAQNSAVSNFEMAQRREPSTDEHKEYLGKALDLTRRATRDAQLARKLNPEVNVIMPEIDYQIIFNGLQDFIDQLYFAREFPTLYKQLIPLHFQMKKAVRNEDYESAAKLRDEMRAITSRAQLQ